MKPIKIKYYSLLAITIVASMLLAACSSITSAMAQVYQPGNSQAPADAGQANSPAKSDKIEPLVFQQAMRKLWEDHITWTRVFIISDLASLPDADAAAQRLLQNQVDIGNAVKTFYGDTAGNQLTELLREHILIAADILSAAKAGDNDKLEAAKKKWYDNANEIAAYLNQANPKNWSLSDMQKMMKMHLDLTLEEATARLTGDWAGDVVAYDKVHDEILSMADMLAVGIVNQFPDKFTHKKVSEAQIELTLAMDKLWEDHVTWTRVYIISTLAGLPDADTTAQRLLRNQDDIGNAIKAFYGKQAGDQLTALLREHILLAADLLADAKAGDTAKFEEDKAKWYDNANQIASFLNNANPNNWPLSDIQQMMKAHLDLTLEEATARLTGDWQGDVIAYDQVHNEILQMSGMLTQGIVVQFPDKFK